MLTKAKDFYDVSWGLAQLELRSEVKSWIHDAIRRQAGVEWRGGHDEGSYTCFWPSYYLFSGDKRVRSFLLWLRDSYVEWSHENEYHGFRPDARDYVTHTFENAEGFITALCDMDPRDPVNNDLIEDVAHHIGNWVEGIPKWYDWNKHMFVSHWLGTKEVRDYPPYDFDAVRHGRVGMLALTAYKISGKARYINWCEDWLGMWADLIINKCQDKIPVFLYHTPVADWPKCISEHYRSDYIDPYRDDQSDPAEIIRFMLNVYEITKNPKYPEAVRKAIRLYEDKWPLGQHIALLEMYQKSTGDLRYQDKILDWEERELQPQMRTNEPLPTILVIEENKPRVFAYRSKEGNIVDYAGPTPTLLMQGYRASGNLDYLKRAAVLAAKELHLVRYSTRDGREHGCNASRYIHGTGNEAAKTLCYTVGLEKMRYFKADDELGIEERVAVLLDPSVESKNLSLYFYNDLDAEKTVKVGPKGTEKELKNVMVEGKLIERVSNRRIEICLKPKQVTKVELTKNCH